MTLFITSNSNIWHHSKILVYYSLLWWLNFTLIPDSVYNRTISLSQFTLTMEFSIQPLSNIVLFIWPKKFSLSRLLVVLITAYIFSSIFPCECTLTMHFIIFPFTLIFTSISPLIHSLSFNIIIVEFTSICRTI